MRRPRLASGRSRRRLSGGLMIKAAVLHLLRADKSAGLAGHVKRRVQSPPRRDGRHSCRPASLRQSSFRLLLTLRSRRGSGDAAESVSWSGRRPKADHVVFFLTFVCFVVWWSWIPPSLRSRASMNASMRFRPFRFSQLWAGPLNAATHHASVASTAGAMTCRLTSASVISWNFAAHSSTLRISSALVPHQLDFHLDRKSHNFYVHNW